MGLLPWNLGGALSGRPRGARTRPVRGLRDKKTRGVKNHHRGACAGRLLRPPYEESPVRPSILGEGSKMQKGVRGADQAQDKKSKRKSI